MQQRIAAPPKKCARLLGINADYLYAAIERGEITTHAIGRKSLIWIDDLRSWLKQKPKPKTSRPQSE